MQLNRAVPEQISGSFDVHTGLKPRHGRVMAQRVHAHALDACLVGEPRYHVPSVRKCPLVVVIAGRRLASVAEITVARAGVERLDELVGFWKLLHRHQSSVAPAVPGLDVLSESDSAVIVGKMYREWLSSPDSFAFFAEEEGRLVGYVVGFYDEPHFMWSTGRVGHIDSFYVLPELRGRGVGRLLMEAAYAEMRQAGATTVALEMVANNHLAQKFYEREGFTTTFVQIHRRLGPD